MRKRLTLTGALLALLLVVGTTTASAGSPPAKECGKLHYPMSQFLVTKITATGVSCKSARALVRYAGSRNDSPIRKCGPSQCYKVHSYNCMSRAHGRYGRTRCVDGDRVVVWHILA